MGAGVSATRATCFLEAYRLPESLQDARFSHMPLCLVDSPAGDPRYGAGCLRRISISPRRAGDIFLYISRADHINCRQSCLSGTKQKWRHTGVVRVFNRTPSSGSSSIRATKTVSVVLAGQIPKPGVVRGLRSWMATRHVGEPVSVKYLLSGYGRDGK